MARLRSHAAPASPLSPRPAQEGNTPLQIASAQGHLAVVLQLLQPGTNPNVQNQSSGNTPLHVAAAGGHADVVRALLSNGADRSRSNHVRKNHSGGPGPFVSCVVFSLRSLRFLKRGWRAFASWTRCRRLTLASLHNRRGDSRTITQQIPRRATSSRRHSSRVRLAPLAPRRPRKVIVSRSVAQSLCDPNPILPRLLLFFLSGGGAAPAKALPLQQQIQQQLQQQLPQQLQQQQQQKRGIAPEVVRAPTRTQPPFHETHARKPPFPACFPHLRSHPPLQSVHEVASRALLEASRNRAIEEEARLAREVSLLDSFLEDTLLGSLSAGGGGAGGAAAPGAHSTAVLQAHIAQARVRWGKGRLPFFCWGLEGKLCSHNCFRLLSFEAGVLFASLRLFPSQEEELARWRQEQSARQARRERRQQQQQEQKAASASTAAAQPAPDAPDGAAAAAAPSAPAPPEEADPLRASRDAAFRRQMDAAAYLKDKVFPLEVAGGGAFAIPGGAVPPSQRPTGPYPFSPSPAPSPTASAGNSPIHSNAPSPSPTPPGSFRAAGGQGFSPVPTHQQSVAVAQAEEMLAAVQRSVGSLGVGALGQARETDRELTVPRRPLPTFSGPLPSFLTPPLQGGLFVSSERRHCLSLCRWMTAC